VRGRSGSDTSGLVRARPIRPPHAKPAGLATLDSPPQEHGSAVQRHAGVPTDSLTGRLSDGSSTNRLRAIVHRTRSDGIYSVSRAASPDGRLARILGAQE